MTSSLDGEVINKTKRSVVASFDNGAFRFNVH